MSQTTADSVEGLDVQEPLRPELPYAFAKRFGIILLYEADKPVLCYRKGVELSAIAEARRYLGQPLTLHELDDALFQDLLNEHYEHGSNGAIQVMGELDEDMDLRDLAEHLPEPEDLMDSEDDAPIIRLINALITQAVHDNASDIHIEPYEHRLAVRYRLDGVLREVLEPPQRLGPLLVSRIKVMAKMDIAEKRLPQDGHISLRVAGHPVDIRVSTLPSGHGERVVLRLLDKQAGRLELSQLGMDPKLESAVDELIHKPHGIILVTGPTGSGKTTTLYAVLSRLNDKSRNIMTVEDPIEYFIDGIAQTQVNQKVDMSFARGLRAILRQDPDVVMVGEIRDPDTVQIAVRASLTGHLVLSTLHTNTAVGAVTRLRDMEVEPFLLSSTLLGILAQRLVRVLCPHCKRPYQASTVECEMLDVSPVDPPMIYGPSGCEHCDKSGYRGRTGIYEFVEVNSAMRNMIHSNASEHELEEYARSYSLSILQDGIRLVLAGITSVDEVMRVTQTE